MWIKSACVTIEKTEAVRYDQPDLNAGTNHFLEHQPEHRALAEPAMAVLGKRRVIRHRGFEPEPAEPLLGQVEPNFLAEFALRADRIAVADQQHRGPSGCRFSAAVKVSA